MDEPCIDVVVASNRRSPYLEEALASVRSQTWTGWRLILVDNGSPDPEFFVRLASQTPGTVLVRREPSGVSAARNEGFLAGEGELVAFLDDDDVWHPDRLALQVRALQENPGAVGAYTGGWYLDADGVEFGERWLARPTPSASFLGGDVAMPRLVTLLVPRDACLLSGLFDESLAYAEDNDFVMRLLQLGEMAAVSAPLVGYRRHALNVTNSANVLRRRSSERFLLKQIDIARRDGRRHHADLLAQNYRRLRRLEADDCIGSVARALKARDGTTMKAELIWATTAAPFATARAVAARGRRRLLAELTRA